MECDRVGCARSGKGRASVKYDFLLHRQEKHDLEQLYTKLYLCLQCTD